MKPSLQLRQTQQLTLTPQLQQSIRLLQLSTLEIHREVMRLLDENPLLERAEENTSLPHTENHTLSGHPESQHPTSSDPTPNTDSDWSKEEWEKEANAKDEWPTNDTAQTNTVNEDWGSNVGNSNTLRDDNESRTDIATNTPSLREHLILQLSLSQLDARDREIIGLLIDALDDNGYLSISLDEIIELPPASVATPLPKKYFSS